MPWRKTASETPGTLRFWDANAIVPLTVNEERSADIRNLHETDDRQIVWWGTRIECISALSRKTREGAITPVGHARARIVLHFLSESWNEIHLLDRVRLFAERLLVAHPLKAADALQLAAAFVWCAGSPQGREFVCLDRQLSTAADAEGFTVVP